MDFVVSEGEGKYIKTENNVCIGVNLTVPSTCLYTSCISRRIQIT